MTNITLELLPSKPLLLSHEIAEVISTTFERHGISILKSSVNNTIRLRFRFEKQERKLKRQIGEIRKKMKEAKQPEMEMTLEVFKNMQNSAMAEEDIASKTFLLNISENAVTIETRAKKLTEISFLYLQSYFSSICTYVCEAYAEIGENISLREKYGNLLEKLQKAKNANS